MESVLEIWKNIPGYDGVYEISNQGRVYSHKSKKYLKPAFSYDGHTLVGLFKNHTVKQFYIHRLVAEAFLPNPDNLPIVHHIDDNPRNNRIDNLLWCTQKENVHHTILAGKHGTMNRK